MKSYLKMSDVFGGCVISNIFREIKCEGDVVVAVAKTGSAAQAIAHAINSHDELVVMNRELLDVLNEVASSLSWLAHGECMGFVDGPILTSSEAINKARLAITKAKGGAA